MKNVCQSPKYHYDTLNLCRVRSAALNSTGNRLKEHRLYEFLFRLPPLFDVSLAELQFRICEAPGTNTGP